ncbi:Prophage antirepressor [Prevotella sp. tc2-28]|uniref:BRO family protein n=1 Tax=Prevotella sp. tc2-28 TaxID=1761888 RepID=UPI00089640DC|nr:BRO family protein [Prevotella sp. tc2-28]SEA02810.1 Prophage antirepressor [Prevotella sp. tc2-28]
MKANIQIFTSDIFGEIRTCQVNNQIMFVGKDVATALGYSKPENAIATHVDTDDKTTTLIQGTGSNYKSKVVIINESGLYALILSSKLPQAKAFKRWVTSEVLPQIRKTGGYIPTKDANGRQLSNEEIINRADAIVCRTLCMLNADAEDTLTATQVAKTFNMSVYDFNCVVRDMGIQYRRGGHWNICDDLADRDFVRMRTHVSYSLKGVKKVKVYMTWTLDGLRYLNSKLGYPNF